MEQLKNSYESLTSTYKPKHQAPEIEKKEKNQQVINEIEKAFVPFGLGENEKKVFLHLTLVGTQKARDISTELSIHRTETYRILKNLEGRGIVSVTLEKPLKFTAASFSEAYDILIKTEKLNLMNLERKKSELVTLWQSVPKKKREFREKEVFQILEGEERITLRINEIAKKTANEICISIPDTELLRLYHSDLPYYLNRNKQRINIRFITNSSAKSRYIVEKMNLENVKFMLADSEELPTFIISDNETLLFLIKDPEDLSECSKCQEKKPNLLWTNYRSFIKPFNMLFNNLWNEKNYHISKKMLSNKVI